MELRRAADRKFSAVRTPLPRLPSRNFCWSVPTSSRLTAYVLLTHAWMPLTSPVVTQHQRSNPLKTSRIIDYVGRGSTATHEVRLPSWPPTRLHRDYRKKLQAHSQPTLHRALGQPYFREGRPDGHTHHVLRCRRTGRTAAGGDRVYRVLGCGLYPPHHRGFFEGAVPFQKMLDFCR